jgi:MFS superfamily sulfate permease-like transporter
VLWQLLPPSALDVLILCVLQVKLLYKMDRAMFGVCVASAVVCVVEDPTVGIIAGAVLAMLRLMVQVGAHDFAKAVDSSGCWSALEVLTRVSAVARQQMRGAHAMLYIFQGTKCRLSFLFDTHDESKRVRLLCARY